MKCEKCGKNEATMYYKETVNGVTREMHLCPARGARPGSRYVPSVPCSEPCQGLFP